jgi:uncharacterized protein YecT (DUF1311 family)
MKKPKFSHSIKTLILFLIVSITLETFGQEGQEEHPLNIKLKTCLDSEENYTTSGMIGCLSDALEMWESELNIQYNSLLELLSEKQIEMLRTSQKTWIEYRDREIDLINLFYGDLDGSMWTIAIAFAKLDLVRQRALELTNYNLTFAGEKE